MLKRDNKPDDPAPSSYFEVAKASISLDEPGGKFVQSTTVVGTTPIPAYPAASVPNADVGEEPPTGEAIDAVEPCGTPVEVEASIARQRECKIEELD